MESPRLPNAIQAWIPAAKLTEYLLSLTHPRGRPKALFFRRCGFYLEDWQALEEALLRQARAGVVVEEIPAVFGVHYVVEGPIASLDGRSPLVWTIWIVEHGKTAPRLVSAYPARRPHV